MHPHTGFSFGVAAFGIRVNTFANSRTSFASLRGKPFPCYDIPLQAGMSIGMMLISVELLMMLFILLFPFIVMISTSFKTLREVSQIPPTFIPRASCRIASR